MELEDFLDRPVHEKILRDIPSHTRFEYKATNKNILYCPCCSPQKKLELKPVESGKDRLACDDCGWIYYDNPLMVSTGLVVFPERFIGEKNVQGPFDFRASDFFEIGPNGGLKLKPTGVTAIKRNKPPFVGGWAFPGGFTDWRETPRRGTFREVSEEAGLETCIRADSVVCACNPDPSHLNQNTVTQLGIPVAGTLLAGDDASDVRIYGKEDMPKLCFSSHQRTVDKWFRGRYAALLKSFFLDPDEEAEEV